MKDNFTSRFAHSIVFVPLLVALAVRCDAHSRVQARPSSEQIPVLTLNQTVPKRLRGGESHYYKLKLRAGEYGHLTAQQQGIDIVLTVTATNQAIRVDRPNAAYGREGLSLVAQEDTEYLVLIKSLDPQANEADYSITFDVKRPALPRDQKMIAAEMEVTKAEDLRSIGTPRDLERAVAGFQRALGLWRELNDPYEQAVALYGLAYSYRFINEYQKSVSASLEALSIIRDLKDQNLDAALLTALGWAYVYLGDSQQAFDSFTRALTLRRLTGDKNGEALTLYGVGWFYALTDNNERALDIFNETLALRRQTKSLAGQAVTLIGIAKILHRLGKHSEAIDSLGDAIKILRGTRIKNSLAEALSSLGWVEFAINATTPHSLTLTKP